MYDISAFECVIKCVYVNVPYVGAVMTWCVFKNKNSSSASVEDCYMLFFVLFRSLYIIIWADWNDKYNDLTGIYTDKMSVHSWKLTLYHFRMRSKGKHAYFIDRDYQNGLFFYYIIMYILLTIQLHTKFITNYIYHLCIVPLWGKKRLNKHRMTNNRLDPRSFVTFKHVSVNDCIQQMLDLFKFRLGNSLFQWTEWFVDFCIVHSHFFHKRVMRIK